jgi:metacaspase-1
MASRALCIGINDYPGTGSDLAGCVNDAHDWRDALDSRGFATAVMLDAEATKANMTKSIEELVATTQSGDVGVITYSGHGSWVIDEDQDEPDGRDEVLCPHDIADGHPLTDDELFDLFSDRERGARLVLISDSCHSGTVHKLLAASGDEDETSRARYLGPEVFLSEDETRRASRAARLPMGKSRQSALLISGCQDTEYSYDASFGGRPNGAFTYFALQTLAGLGGDRNYRDWYAAIRSRLPSAAHPQTPNLQGSYRQRRWKVLD